MINKPKKEILLEYGDSFSSCLKSLRNFGCLVHTAYHPITFRVTWRVIVQPTLNREAWRVFSNLYQYHVDPLKKNGKVNQQADLVDKFHYFTDDDDSDSLYRMQCLCYEIDLPRRRSEAIKLLLGD